MGAEGHYLAIDPGKRGLGWAEFGGGTLLKCGLARHDCARFENGIGVMLDTVRSAVVAPLDAVIVEVPRIYPKDRKHDPNDMIDLATISGACATLAPPVFVYPARWKGQTPKNISHERTRNALSPSELVRLDACLAAFPKGLQHNVLDAVGIGLWWRTR